MILPQSVNYLPSVKQWPNYSMLQSDWLMLYSEYNFYRWHAKVGSTDVPTLGQHWPNFGMLSGHWHNKVSLIHCYGYMNQFFKLLFENNFCTLVSRLLMMWTDCEEMHLSSLTIWHSFINCFVTDFLPVYVFSNNNNHNEKFLIPPLLPTPNFQGIFPV